MFRSTLVAMALIFSSGIAYAQTTTSTAPARRATTFGQRLSGSTAPAPGTTFSQRLSGPQQPFSPPTAAAPTPAPAPAGNQTFGAPSAAPPVVTAPTGNQIFGPPSGVVPSAAEATLTNPPFLPPSPSVIPGIPLFSPPLAAPNVVTSTGAA